MRGCKERGCSNRVGIEFRKCPEHRRSRVSETTAYDPRHDRAQTVEGAKARYVSDDCPEYGEEMLEADLERLIGGDEHPDETPKQNATRELFVRHV